MEKFKNIYKSLEGCGAGVPLLYNLLPVHSAKNDNVASKKSQKKGKAPKNSRKQKGSKLVEAFFWTQVRG